MTGLLQTTNQALDALVNVAVYRRYPYSSCVHREHLHSMLRNETGTPNLNATFAHEVNMRCADAWPCPDSSLILL